MDCQDVKREILWQSTPAKACAKRAVIVRIRKSEALRSIHLLHCILYPSTGS